MANILTYIELSNNEATDSSLSALNRGRDIASNLGATLYALLPCAATPTYDDEDIIAVLSRHGADKVILVSHPRLAPPALFATHGEALVSACRQFPPRLVFFPSSAEARDLAPRLAMALRAHYIPDATLQLQEGRYVISRRVFRRRYELVQPLDPMEDPVVVTLQADHRPETLGDDEAEVVVVHAPVEASSAVRIHKGPVQLSAPDGPTLGGGAGLGDAAAFEMLERIASALGGVSAASRSARDGDLARSQLQVGFDGVTVQSDLYVALGVSGSERHVAGLAPHTEVVAVNTDRKAPIFSIARHGLVADAGEVLRELVSRLGTDGEPR